MTRRHCRPAPGEMPPRLPRPYNRMMKLPCAPLPSLRPETRWANREIPFRTGSRPNGNWIKVRPFIPSHHDRTHCFRRPDRRGPCRSRFCHHPRDSAWGLVPQGQKGRGWHDPSAIRSARDDLEQLREPHGEERARIRRHGDFQSQATPLRRITPSRRVRRPPRQTTASPA